MSETSITSVSPVWLVPHFLYKWLMVVPILVLSTGVIGVLIIIFSMLGMPDFSSRVFATFWARFNALVSLITVTVHGKDKVDTRQSYVVAANHQSLIDIYVIYGFSGFNLRWVMKKELRKIPVFGLAADKMGQIIIDRSNHEAAVASINAARERILRGNSVVFFPEGTRSRTDQMLPFKKGAFRLAIDLGLPVLPVYIRGTREILPSDTLDWRPGHASMVYLDPIPTDGMTTDDVNRLSRMTREAIEAAQSEQTAT